MNALSEVSQLFAQRAGDVEKAREIFTAETRNYVSSILASMHQARAEPWLSARVRIDIPRETETELRAGYLTSQYAIARITVRFKKGTNFQAVGEVRFGVEFDQTEEAFVWAVSLVPETRYQRLDDVIWRQFRASGLDLPGARHQERANTVRFVQRPVGGELSSEVAFNDVKVILEMLVGADSAFAEAVGLEPDRAGV